MIRSLFVLLVISVLVTSAPATVAGQAATPVTPSLTACTVSPRTPEELHALLGDDYVAPSPTPLAVQATPGGEWEIGIDALPEGVPADSAEIEAVVQEMYACLAAGDMLRYLALFSDDLILHSRFLSRIGMSMATPDLRTPTPIEHNLPHQTRGLFHARLLPDGRMAAVSPLGFLGLPELYLFVREDERWLIDDIVPMSSEYAPAGADRTAFTGAEFIASSIADVVIFGWGLEFGPAWTPVIDAEPSRNLGLAVLSNGVSTVIAGIPGAAAGSDLSACVQPTPRELASSLKDAGLRDVAVSVKQGLVPVQTADGTPVQGADENRAFAIYELADPGGTAGTDGAMQVYLECRNMADGAWILGVTQLVPATAFDAESAKRDELLATLEDWNPGQAPAN